MNLVFEGFLYIHRRDFLHAGKYHDMRRQRHFPSEGSRATNFYRP
jgi:hypothetical protein